MRNQKKLKDKYTAVQNYSIIVKEYQISDLY